MWKRNAEVDRHLSPSAFKSPDSFLQNFGTLHRDSGYGTDISPASATSTSRRLTSESDIDEPVFDISLESDTLEQRQSLCDEEEEELLADFGELGKESRAVSKPIRIDNKRQGILVQSPLDNQDSEDVVIDSEQLILMRTAKAQTRLCCLHRLVWAFAVRIYVSKAFFRALYTDSDNQIPWAVHCDYQRQHQFQSAKGVNVENKAPTLEDQMEARAASFQNAATFQQNRIRRGNTVPHLRFQSEDGEEEESSHLHDAIPFQRDRSISLPEIKPLRQQYEQDVGRELRRISDEFDSSFHRRRALFHYATSLPKTIHLKGYWNSLRKHLSADLSKHGDNMDDHSDN